MAATAALAVLGLSALAGVRAQVTDVSLVFPATAYSDLPLSGEIVGTGADGTTYVVSAAGTDAGDIPFAMTIVQDATHVSEVFAVATDVGVDAQCVYNAQGEGTCTIVYENAGTASIAAPQTTMVTGTIPMVAVPVSTGSPESDPDSDSGDGAGEGDATGSASASEASSTSAAVRSSVTVGLVAISSVVMALVAVLSA